MCIGSKVTKIFIFPYSFFVLIFYLCRPDWKNSVINVIIESVQS